MQFRALRLFLAFSAFGWAMCIAGVFASSLQINSIVQGKAANLA